MLVKRLTAGSGGDKIRPVAIFIEAVACSVDDCLEAEAGGADRLELCSAMMVGGLTPSLGTLIDARTATPLPIVTMIRPRAGGFCYTPREFSTMMRDAELAARHGADGLVFGILTAEGRLDAARCQEFLDAARQAGVRQTTFHRAFDVTPDPHDALLTLIDLGVTRILTSGREPTALKGAPLIRQLAARAAGRIEILPGGGIREDNVEDVIQATGLRQVHLGPFILKPDVSGRANPALTFSTNRIPPEGQYQLADRAALARVRQAAGER
jgi:copper homeostasis protein